MGRSPATRREIGPLRRGAARRLRWAPWLLGTLPSTLATPGLALAQRAEAGDLPEPPTPVGVEAAPHPAPEAPPRLAPPVEHPGPWRAHEALGWSWLRFGLDHRTRFEHLTNDFRVSNPGNATGVSMRTLLSAELRLLPVVVGAELQDSRAWFTQGTPLNTTLVDPLEILQAYAGLNAESVLAPGDAVSLTAGRLTMDVGSRRLVARNEYRNTINGFTGVDLQWRSPWRDVVRTFAVMPVVRLPTDAAALAGNRIELDRESTDAIFWGVFFQSRLLPGDLMVETYVLGLHERDGDFAPSSNRRLLTPGVRALRVPAPERFDVQAEVMAQLGTSRASTAPTDVTDLDHLAMSLHASVGYRFAVPWAPRIVAQYDYASGDRAPDDGTNGRFDPLFGARRFELGPTGLYGAFARSNLRSPGLRIEIAPHRTVDAFAGYRASWLASPRDTWTTTGLRDASGSSGSFLGHQLEGRVRWHVMPRNLSLDVGGALLVPGAFARAAPSGDGQLAPYLYTQLTGTI